MPSTTIVNAISPFSNVAINPAWAHHLPLHPTLYPSARVDKVFFWLQNLTLRARLLEYLVRNGHNILAKLLQLFITQEEHRLSLETLTIYPAYTGSVHTHQCSIQTAIVLGVIELLITNDIEDLMIPGDPNDFSYEVAEQLHGFLMTTPTICPITRSQFPDDDSSLSDGNSSPSRMSTSSDMPSLMTIDEEDEPYFTVCQLRTCSSPPSSNTPAYHIWCINPNATCLDNLNIILHVCWLCFQWQETYDGLSIDEGLINGGYERLLNPTSPLPDTPSSSSSSSMPPTPKIIGDDGWEVVDSWMDPKTSGSGTEESWNDIKWANPEGAWPITDV